MSAEQQSNGAVAPSTSADTTRSTSSDNLTCQWGPCSERCESAETLYDHICERHVGRKSTNNLNLICGWSNCRTSTVKRDHITSHIRVHVPLKPHKCDFCGKSFKRPQDLKKHVKTHADDSVLLQSPVPQGGSAGHYRPQHGKATATGFYDHGHSMHQTNGGYGQPHHSAHNAYYQPQAPTQQQAFHSGPVYYNVAHNVAHAGGELGGYNGRKRDLETLNEFFGDAKRGRFDAGSYPQVNQRLMALHGIPISGGSIVDYMPAAPAMVSVGGGHHTSHSMPQSHYSLPPMPNLRTKSDLMNIDTFLDQMSSTVYESSTASAAAGLHQPGAHYTHTGINFRTSHSPPLAASQHLMGSEPSQVSSASHTGPLLATTGSQSPHSTPALTPPSSISYTSGLSPVSSAPGLSPSSRHSSAVSANYPRLPAASIEYGSHSQAAPVATLGTSFEADPRRRFSGGLLQKSAVPQITMMSPIDTSAHVGKREPHDSQSDLVAGKESTPVPESMISKTRRSSSSSETESEAARDKAQEIWVENIRVIEALRKYVADLLREHQYDDDDDVEMGDAMNKKEASATPSQTETPSLYPILRVDG